MAWTVRRGYAAMIGTPTVADPFAVGGATRRVVGVDERAQAPAPVVVGVLDDLIEPVIHGLLDASPALKVVARRVSADALSEVIASASPRVAVVELGRISTERLKELTATQRSTAFVVFGPRPTREERLEVAAAGAELLTTAAERRDVEHVLHRAARLGREPQPSWAALELLTPAEQRVYRLLLADRSNREIARQLGRGEETIRTHVARILRKLGAKSRKELLDTDR